MFEISEGQQSDGVLGEAQLVQQQVGLAELVPVWLLGRAPPLPSPQKN